VIGTPNTAQQCLRAGLADELHVDIMPVLLSSGLRFFENMEQISLERIQVIELPAGRTHLEFRIIR
jgi:dihydrofolate reductase